MSRFFILGFLFVFFFALCGGKICLGQIKTETQGNDTTNISLCDLVAKPNLYNEKTVKIKAIYMADFESAALYDLNCNKMENYIYPNWVCNDLADPCIQMMKELDKIIKPVKGKYKAKLIIVGKFVSSTKKNKGYGHLRLLKFKIDITTIEEIERF